MSINGGKTDADADYAQVTHQSGIKAQESTLSVQGQGKFTGGYLITDAGKNQTQFAQGIQTQDIENHLNYEGDAISVGIGIGADTSNPNGKAKPALQGIGYGTIDPVNKTSTTHAAITDQAGLSHINTESFKQEEVQHELNEIITNDFNKEQVLTELGAQVNITTEFGKEAPKAVAEFSQYQQDAILSQLQNIEHLSDEQINQILDEAAKWGEGGIYRVALHTATAALATGTIEGAASAGTTAYAIPKIDEYLKEQGFDETARHSALLALSAGIGTTVGGDAASTANNAGQTQWNYLTHKELQAKIIELNACGFEKSCIDMVNKKYNEISKQNDMALHDSCRAISTDCIGKMRDALDYVGEDKYLDFKTDIHQSRKRVLDVANFNGYYAITDLSTRADYFGAMYDYTKQPWFRVAEKHSRGFLQLADRTGKSQWVADAGRVIMAEGQKDFVYIYQNHKNTDYSWSATRLHTEQDSKKLQEVHEMHYNSWMLPTRIAVNKIVGGEFLKPDDRINKGCEDMPEVSGCMR
ncbi:hypothetical protein [Moraxella porci]|uniref:hypothetical protein n=1 Tax=Moraxella porci TaxID=1288392 RepID=UPI002446AB64|nr:hypothetical protein [Moraxella porci]MDH2274520.1 hypothetical protein [Moraxella porci]